MLIPDQEDPLMEGFDSLGKKLSDKLPGEFVGVGHIPQ